MRILYITIDEKELVRNYINTELYCKNFKVELDKDLSDIEEYKNEDICIEFTSRDIRDRNFYETEVYNIKKYKLHFLDDSCKTLYELYICPYKWNTNDTVKYYIATSYYEIIKYVFEDLMQEHNQDKECNTCENYKKKMLKNGIDENITTNSLCYRKFKTKLNKFMDSQTQIDLEYEFETSYNDAYKVLITKCSLNDYIDKRNIYRNIYITVDLQYIKDYIPEPNELDFIDCIKIIKNITDEDKYKLITNGEDIAEVCTGGYGAVEDLEEDEKINYYKLSKLSNTIYIIRTIDDTETKLWYFSNKNDVAEFCVNLATCDHNYNNDCEICEEFYTIDEDKRETEYPECYERIIKEVNEYLETSDIVYTTTISASCLEDDLSISVFKINI